MIKFKIFKARVSKEMQGNAAQMSKTQINMKITQRSHQNVFLTAWRSGCLGNNIKHDKWPEFYTLECRNYAIIHILKWYNIMSLHSQESVFLQQRLEGLQIKTRRLNTHHTKSMLKQELVHRQPRITSTRHILVMKREQFCRGLLAGSF